ncbi:MAG: hypothetical protein LBB22_03800 [Treponema sp.]|nr:hypothetical protein [Treponema sp.]
MKKLLLSQLFCLAVLSQCDIYNKPLMEPRPVKPDGERVIAIYVSKYPYPNVFTVGDKLPLKKDDDGGGGGWMPEDALEITGLTDTNPPRVLAPDEYTISSLQPEYNELEKPVFDSDDEGILVAYESAEKLTVTVTLNDNDEIKCKFYIKITPADVGDDIVEIKDFSDKSGHGWAVPFPSKAKPGDKITVYVNSDRAYICSNLCYKYDDENRTISLDENGTYTFTMPEVQPGGVVELEADFRPRLEAMRVSGRRTYYESLAEAIYSDGTKGVVWALKDIELNSGIVIGAGGSIALKVLDEMTTSEITIKRGEIYTESLFKVENGGLLVLGEANGVVFNIDGNGSGVIATEPLISVGNGGSFYMYGNTALINNKIEVDSHGGGLHVFQDSYAEIHGGIISGNKVKYGGGIQVGHHDLYGGSDKTLVQILGGSISENKAYMGGGINVDRATLKLLDGVTITSNEVGTSSADYPPRGGGIHINNGGSVSVINGRIFNNKTSSSNGSGVYVDYDPKTGSINWFGTSSSASANIIDDVYVDPHSSISVIPIYP